ncbi:Na-translocating system protein MpsC family protein [Halalkalibacter okhensis]|uniref:Na+-translocating membrane potential-generating system MpsC domain-containing protein n=1 Tax=Halalkalibacter okhensis TaxID=333138 RepID=A0A0B0IMX4_9BACI|nr:Na-translocating system protein MpsC family protein [Halalkalibacter okhensis]KHF41379.1 hypothetical protein LQ50_03870 [Halalkalibacter okhensis]
MIKESHQQQDLTYLSSFICKIMKRRLGKGPEQCNIVVKNNLVIVKIHNFITPAEEVLCHKQELSLALKFRSVLVKAIIEEVKADITKVTRVEITKSLFDWDYEKNVGIMMFVGNESLHTSPFANTMLEDSFIDKIKIISDRIHKRPSSVKWVLSDPVVQVIECNDVLIKTESLLFENGYEDLLLERGQEIRKNYNDYCDEFESILGQSIRQLFVTWDYESNKNYLIFFVK